MNKKEFRKKERLVDIPNREEKNKLIAKRVIELCSSYKVVGVYLSTPNEVETDGIIEELLKQGKIVAAPRIENSELVFHKLESIKDIDLNKYHIREPLFSNEVIDNIEIMIVPGIAFDIAKNRIGYGKGYYDRYLERLNMAEALNVKTVMAAYSLQKVSHIPTDITDIRPERIVTEETV